MSGLVVDAERCVGCKRCVRACAFGGIVVEGRLARPTDACTICGSCVEACPVQALSIDRGRAAAGDGTGADASVCRDIWVVAQLDAAGAVLPVTFELIAKARELASCQRCQRGQSLLAERRVVAVLAEGAAAESRALQLIAAGVDEVLRCRDGRFPSADTALLATLIAELARERYPETVLFAGRRRSDASWRRGSPCCCRRDSRQTARSFRSTPKPGCFVRRVRRSAEISWRRSSAPCIDRRWRRCAQGCFRSRGTPAHSAPAMLHPGPSPISRSMRRCIHACAGSTWSRSQREPLLRRSGSSWWGAVSVEKNLPLMKRLVELLDADLGCTRPLVEAGWLDYAHQVGQTGASVAPELLLSLGVSGAIQHLAGMGGAQTVIAVNEDSSAPIFGVRRGMPSWVIASRLPKNSSVNSKRANTSQ